MMEVDGITQLSCGATFFRADLHIHSHGGSFDVSDPSATPANIVAEAKRGGLSIIAIADHNEICNVAPAVAEGAKEGVLTIPAVELSTPEGHLLCYAPTPDTLEKFFNRLNIVDRRKDSCRCLTGMAECLSMVEQVGGFGIIAHIEIDGAFETNLARFKPAKLDIICHRGLLGFEVKRADCPIYYNDDDGNDDRKGAARERISRLKRGSSQFLARVLNSDAHTLNAVGRNARNDERVTRYKMEAPSFEGLKIALQEPDTRVRLEEEIPARVPIVKGVTFEGGFLDKQAIHFSPNLTCIIGGRGSGKSTAFEAVRLLGGVIDTDERSVVDSDVWPDAIGLFCRDETGQMHILSRGRGESMENVDDPVLGLTVFPIESYRQAETNAISARVQDDPLALMTFLDRMIVMDDMIEKEQTARKVLYELTPKIAEAMKNVARIADAERDLATKKGKVERLKAERGEEFIHLQRRLESEKRTRHAVMQKMTDLQSAISHGSVTEITEAIRSTIEAGEVSLAADEASTIIMETKNYETSVAGVSQNLKNTTDAFAAKVRAQITAWSGREAKTVELIETKKRELLAEGITLDMAFITKLISDEASAVERLHKLKLWPPHLQNLQKQYREALKARWSARDAVSSKRAGFAIKATAALRNSVSDLYITLKFDSGGLSPDARQLLIDAMGWKTLAHSKATALIEQIGVRRLLELARKKESGPIRDLRGADDRAVFGSHAEIDLLLQRVSEVEWQTQLEAVAIYDAPRLTVTKKVVRDGRDDFMPRDFKRLSLGQQQSVLLALMLTSESRAPLIVDQPEDNLDSEFIYKTLVPAIRRAKERRQVIVVTHNANIAVLGDAEQIIVLKATQEKGLIMCRGSIDEPGTREQACAILEGTREAFDRRANIYGISV